MQPGQVIGNYTIDEEIGRGAVAVVYRATHRVLETSHAVKVLRVDDPELRARMVAEGRAQARLRHQNVVRVTDVVAHEGRPCLIMDFVPGPTLARLLSRVRPTEAEVARIFLGVVRGVTAAHEAGIIHRDLKPSNVLLDARTRPAEPRVVDFGIARALDVGQGTLAGRVLGTPGYMAPEQLLGAAGTGPAVDVFALGVLLVELWTGELPYPYDDPAGWLARVGEAGWTPPPGGSATLATVARACLAFDAAERPADGAAVLAMIEGSPSRTPGRRPPLGAARDLANEPRAGSERASAHARDRSAEPQDLGRSSRSVASPSARSSLVRIALGALLGGSVVAGLAVAPWPRPVEPPRSAAQGLELRAWRAAGERPDVALALLRAVSSERGEPLPQEVIGDLILAGAASQVLPLDASVVGVDLVDGVVAAATVDGRVFAWRSDTGERIAKVETGVEQPRDVRLLPGASMVTLRPHPGIGRASTDAAIWALSDGRAVLREPLREPEAIVVTADGEVVVTRGKDGRSSLHRRTLAGEAVWDLDLGGKVHGVRVISDDVLLVQTGDRFLLVSTADGAVIADATPAQAVPATAADLGAVMLGTPEGLHALSPGGRLATIDGGMRGAVAVQRWGGETFAAYGPGWRHVEVFDRAGRWRARVGSAGASVTGAVYLDPTTLGLSARDGSIALHAVGGPRLGSLRGHRGYISAMATDEALIATASIDRTVRLWRRPSAVLGVSGRRDAPWPPADGAAHAIGDALVLVTSSGLRVWSPAEDRATEHAVRLPGPLAVGGDQDGRALVAKGPDPLTWILRPPAEEVFRTTLPSVAWLSASPGAEDVLVSSRERLSLFDAAGNEVAGGPISGSDPRLGWIRGGAGFVVAHGPSGLLDVWTRDPPARVSRLEHGLVGQRGPSALVVSPDGQTVVLGLYGGGVIAWRVGDTALRPLGVLSEDPLRVATDGRRAAAVTRHGELAVWDLDSPTLISRHQLRGFPTAARFVGEALVLGDVDGRVTWWRDGELVERPAHHRPVRVLAVDPATGTLWTGSEDGIAWAWPDAGRDVAPYDLHTTGALTNLRVCREDGRVVPVVPWPAPETVWAPAAACGAGG